MNKPPDPSPFSFPISFFPCWFTVQGSESFPNPYCLYCPIKLLWKISKPSLARRCLNYFSLNSSCFVRSEVNSACSILGCSALERCPTFVKPQWLFRILTVSPLKLSPTFIADLIAHFGAVGVTLGNSIVVLQVADLPNCRFVGSLAVGGLVARLLHLQRGSYLVTVHKLPEWPLPTKHTLSGGLPSLWLSLFMVSPYGHMLRTLCSSIYWLLASLLNDWDEVFEQVIAHMTNGKKTQLRYTAEFLKHAVA
uniref:Uncharacterized protein n=1 Tax=Opuntia streptacantha TaxID=393608 RepID=A0A7C9B2V2_OPUST